MTICSFDDENAIAYITRTDTNNGCKNYVVNDNFTDIEKGNAITIGDTTSTIYYQANDFICGDHIVILRSSILNKLRAIFIVSLLSKERFRYNYGRAFKKDIIEDTKLKLPINKDGNPDWQWIEAYVKETLLPELPPRAKNVWKHSLDTTPLSTDKKPLDTKNWKWFRYDEIFEIRKGKRLTKADMIDGDINYIGATDSNNGITAKISNSEHIHSGNLITVSYNGSIAEVFYQTKPFWATDDVNVLYPKFELNKFIAMFLCPLINKEKYRFNYGRKWDKETMEQSTIKLPATSSGTPDYQFMEDYIKSLPYSRCL